MNYAFLFIIILIQMIITIHEFELDGERDLQWPILKY
jgi:hypothetical protein